MTQQLHHALVYLFVCPKVLMSSALAGVSVGTEEDEGGEKKTCDFRERQISFMMKVSLTPPVGASWCIIQTRA